MMDSNPIQAVFLAWDWLRIQHNPDQDKMDIEDE